MPDDRTDLSEGLKALIERVIANAGLDGTAARQVRSDLTEHLSEGLRSGASDEDLVALFGDPAHTADLLKGLSPGAGRPMNPTRGGKPRILDALRTDLRYTVRVFRKSPTFTLVAASVLALGIGANTVVFTMVNEILLRPLAIADGGSVIDVISDVPGGNSFISFSYPDYIDFRDRNNVLSDLAAFVGIRLRFGDRTSVERITVQLTSASYFSLLGVTAQRGRTDFPAANGPGDPAVVVLSDAFWRRRFGGDLGVIGSTVLFDGEQLTIIGIASPGFTGTFIGFPVDAWAPLAAGHMFMPRWNPTDRGQKRLELIGRVRPGVTAELAEVGLNIVAAQLQDEFPEFNRGLGVAVHQTTGIDHSLRIGVASFLAVLTTLAGLILGIACLNVGSILLVRAMSREREMVVRMAMGARGSRLVGQLLVEATVLVALGTVGAVFAAHFLSAGLRQVIRSFNFGVGLDLTLDWPVFAFTAMASILAAVGASLAPAIHVVRQNPASALRNSGGGRAAGRLRAALVVGQVGMSVVLVLVTGLFVRALVEGLRADPGFDADRVAIFGLSLDEEVGEEEGRVLQQSVAEATRTASPDVAAVSLTLSPPIGFSRTPLTFQIPGKTPPPGQDGFIVDAKTVGSGYFNTVGVPLQSGRDFTEADDREMSRVAVVSQAFVDRYWPGEDPVGRTVTVSGKAVRVVGVARDTHYLIQDPTPDPLLYLSMPGRFIPGLQVIYRTGGLARDVRSDVQRAVGAVTPGSTVIEPLTVREFLRRALLPQQMGVIMIGAMGVVALILAMIGLYGLVQYSVARERRELGIRLALGCSSLHVLAAVSRKALVYVGVGMILGVGASLVLGPLLRSVLVGTNPRDASTYAVVVLSFGAVALIASLFPARRAMHIDPAEALRSE